LAWGPILKRRTNLRLPLQAISFSLRGHPHPQKKTKPRHVQAPARSARADATVAIGWPAVQQDILRLWAAFATLVVRPEYLPISWIAEGTVSSFEMGLREQQAASDDHPKKDRAVRPDCRMPGAA
jgi:hypothetical protein